MLGVLAATVVRVLTAFAARPAGLEAEGEAIAEMRVKVQEHVGRLSVAFHDADATRAIWSRES